MITRKQSLILFFCALFCAAILLAMYSFSPISGELRRESFERGHKKYLPPSASYNLGYNSYYLAGVDHNNNIYLGNSTAPFHMVVIDSSLRDTTHISITLEIDSIVDVNRFKVTVQEPYFFLIHGTMPIVMRGLIGEWRAKPIVNSGVNYFVECFPIGKESFVLRSFSPTMKSYEIGKWTVRDTLRFNYSLLNKQIDGLFCLDGQMHFDSDHKQFVYVHYYRNEIVAFDTILNLTFRQHAIDTFSHARIRIAQLKDNGSMLSSPPYQINVGSSVYNGLLYISSNLLERNEVVEDFINNSIVDQYDLTRFRYLRSLYLRNHKNKKSREIFAFKNGILAMSDTDIVLYRLPKGQ